MGIRLYAHAANKEADELLACLIVGASPAKSAELHEALRWYDALSVALRNAKAVKVTGVWEDPGYLLHRIRRRDAEVDALDTWHLYGFGRCKNWPSWAHADVCGEVTSPSLIDSILKEQGVTLPPLARELITRLTWG